MKDNDKSQRLLIRELEELREENKSLKLKAAQKHKAEITPKIPADEYETLMEIRDRYNELMDKSRDAIFSISLSGILISLNKAFEQITGWKTKQWIGKPFTDLLHPEDIYIANERFSQILKGHDTRATELRIRKKSGDYIFGEFLSFPQIKNGNPSGLLGIARDITERKRTEDDLRASEQKTRAVFDLSYGFIGLLTPNGILMDVNRTALEFAGIEDSTEVIGKPFWETPWWSHSPEVQNQIRTGINTAAKGEYFRAETLHPARDGTMHTIDFTLRPVTNEDGKVIYLIPEGHDITERKNATDAVTESKALLASIIDSTQDLIWSIDSDEFRLLTYNKGLDDFFRREGIQIQKGMLLREILPDKLADKLARLYTQTLKEGSLATKYHTTIGDLTLWMNLNVLYRQNKPYAISVFARDITELVRTEEALIQAKNKAEEGDKLKTAFINNISHEVRTPLNGILGFAELILQTGILEEDKKYYLDGLNTSCERLLDTVTNYMDISRLVSGSMVVQRKTVSLAGVIDEIFSLYEPKCKLKGLDFIKQMPSDANDYSLNCDPALLEKSITHLMNNAIKFTQAGSIILGFRRVKNKFELFVKDTGSGIHPKIYDKVFDPFVQEEASNTRIYEGSGLGLSIAKGLVELMGGKIRMKSVSSKGSSFYINLPDKSITGSAKKSSKKPKPKSETASRQVVLIAEDDELNFALYRTIMQRASLTFVRAKNGKEAVEMCLSNPEISIVLMDIKMPVMDGLEAVQKIRKFNKYLPVIGVTAYAMAGDRETALKAGFDDYLTKPVNPPALLEMIKKYFEKDR